MPTWLFRPLSPSASYLVVAALAVAALVFVIVPLWRTYRPSRSNKPLLRQLVSGAVVLLIFALGLWAGWHKEVISGWLRRGHSKVENGARPYPNAADFAEYAMKLREQGLPKVQPRKTEDLTPEERAIVTRKSADLTAEEQALLDKGGTIAIYSPGEHSRHSISPVSETSDGKNARSVLLFVFGMEDAEPARTEGESMAEARYSRSQADQFLYLEGWDKYHDRFFTRCYVQEGENAYDKAQSAPTSMRGVTPQRFPWKTNIVTTVFWVGQQAGDDDPGSHYRSCWDANWTTNYGGYDNPDTSARRNYIPVAFIPKLNPFYCALPYNDLTDDGKLKPEASEVIPWFKQAYTEPGQSVCWHRWLAIRKGNRTCYAQWEDSGPFRTDHFQYVFGKERPKPNARHGAGLSVSPAVRDYLGLAPTDVTDWQFVEVRDVPPGPWRDYGENNHFVIARRQIEQRTEEKSQRSDAKP